MRIDKRHNAIVLVLLLTCGLIGSIAESASTYRIWNFTIPSSSTGSWTAAEYNEGVAVAGTFERHSTSSFVKMTVSNSSGNYAPTYGTIRWGLEIPGFTFFVEPTMTNETRIIKTVNTGSCPSSPWSGNFIFIGYPNNTYNMNGDTAAYGKFTWTPSTNTLRINNLYKLTAHASMGTNLDIGGTCADGQITLNGSGDRSGKIQISSNAGSLYTVNSPADGKITYATPDVAIPNWNYLKGSYSAYTFDHDPTQTLQTYRVTLSNEWQPDTEYAQFGELDDIEGNNPNMQEGYYFRNIVLNSPSNGFFTANISTVTGGVETTYGSPANTNEVICAVYMAQKTFISCLAKKVGINSNHPLNFIMVSDSQGYSTTTLDTYSFNSTGKLITSMGSYYGSLNGMTLTPDGKIVGVGYAYSTQYDHAVVRYEANGTLDTSFNTTGKVIISANTTFEDRGYAVALQSDGKIVTAGLNANLSGSATNDPVVVRLTTSGALDTTFGTTGIVTASIGTTTEYTYALAIQSDGKIVIGGNTGNGSVQDFHLMRFSTNGTIDSTFDSDGRVITTFAHGFADRVSGVAIQTDGKIVAGGYVYDATWHYEFAATRYLSNGSLDTSFSGDGKAVVNFGAGADYVYALAVQSDGKIVLAGGENSDLSMAIARLTSDGSLDTTFSSDGKFTTTIGAGFNVLYAMAIQGDGKLVGAGKALSGSYYDFALIRVSSAGTLDTSFSADGKHTLSLVSPNYNDQANAVLIQNDRKIILGGSTMESNAVYDDWAVVRMWGN